MAGTIIGLGFLFATAHGVLDRFGRPLGTDFAAFWTAGRMVLQGHAAQTYDWSVQGSFQQQALSTSLFFPWSYPPVFLVIAAALAVLPYLPALLIWNATTLSLALALCWRILPSRQGLLLALGFPAVLVCLGHGQTGFLTAVLLAGGALALPRNKYAAGILFGLLCYKPQFGLLLPFVLAAGRYWRAFATAAVTVLASIAITTAIWGWPVWQAFLDSIPLTRTIVFEAGETGFEKFQSAFAAVRMWGGPVDLAYGVQGVVTIAVLAAAVAVWKGRADFRVKSAALLTGALLSTPYVLDYDLIVFGMALAFLASRGLEQGFFRWEKTLLAGAWLAPLVSRTSGKLLHLPIGFAALAAIFVLTVMHARAGRTEAASHSDPQGTRPDGRRPLGAGLQQA
ncbi:MAG TPA: glycosyltransferase family 87 protein [Pseudolabrys sp.]|nr:glycosyltransferase family 87 protein [Pseudolabrys sp.]